LAGKTLSITGTGTGGVVIVSVALTDFVVSASDVAVIVTVPPAGTTDGAVYLLAREPVIGMTGLNAPQALEAQVAVKITPAFVVSLLTWAVTPSVVFSCKEFGVAVENVIPIGSPTMVRLTLLVCDGLLVTVAVMIIAPSMGATDGAA
jgi:hypothetical protein